MKSLSDKAGFLIVSNLIKYLVGFVMPMVLVRLLERHDYGTYQQMVLISTAAIGLMTWGLPVSIYYFYQTVKKDQLPALVAQTSALLLVSAVITLCVIFFASPWIAERFNNPAMSGGLKLYALSIAFMIASEHYVAVMVAQNRYLLTLVTETGEAVMRVFVLLGPLWMGYGLTGLIAGVIAYTGMRFLVRSFRLFAAGGMNFTGWTRHTFLREQLGYSTPIALMNLCALIGDTFNKGLVAASFTPTDYAIYAVGALSIPLDTIFQSSVGNVLRASLPPMVRRGDLAAVASLLREATRKLSIIVLPSFIFLFGFAREFITVLFTARYQESVSVFQIYVCVVPLYMLMLSPIPQVFGKPRISLYIIVVATPIYLLLSYVLLKTVGFLGAAISAVTIQYLQVFAYMAAVRILTRTTMLRLYPVAQLARTVLVALLSLLVAKLSAGLFGAALANLLFAAAIYSAVFLAVAVFAGVFLPTDKEMIKRWLSAVGPLRKTQKGMAKRIHIQHVVLSLQPGGLENGVVNIVNGLDAARFRSSVSCLKVAGEFAARIKQGDAEIHELGKRPGIDLGLPWRLAQVFRRTRPDIVHTRNADAMFYGFLGARLAGVPAVIHSEHGRTFDERPIRYRVQRAFARRCDALFAVSQQLRQDLVEKVGMQADRLQVLYNGVELRRFDLDSSGKRAAYRAELGLDAGRLLLGSVGRLVQVKNYPLLLRALRDSHMASAMLVLVGDGPERPALEALSRELGVQERVRFPGHRDDVADLLSAMDVFVLPSFSEGMSNTLLEAMAAGIPVVASNVGGTPEIIRADVDGLLFDSADLPGLLAKLSALASDAALRTRLSAAGRQRVLQDFSLEAMIARYEQLYESVGSGQVDRP